MGFGSIFDEDPNEGGSKYEGPSFKMTAGMKKEDGNPKSLKTWRFTSDDLSVLEAIAQLYGGVVEEFTTPDGGGRHVITNATDVEIVIDGPDGVESSLIQWTANGPGHHCNGTVYLSPAEDVGTECACPKGKGALKKIKDAAKKKRGPAPYIKVTFRLAQDLDLGKGEFTNTSWSLAKSIVAVEADLARINDETLVSFAKEYKSFTNDDDELIEYTETVPRVISSFSDAIAE